MNSEITIGICNI